MKISFIGSGNVAWHLSQALENIGHSVEEVYSRNPKHTEALTKVLYNANAHDSLDFRNSNAQLFFLCVSDDAIAEVIKHLMLPLDAILIHTSGSKSLHDMDELLRVYSDIPIKTGVFYPVQTFSKTFHVDFNTIPICIESENEAVENMLITLGQELSDITYAVNSEERRILHVSAVFACNFTNHLLGIAQELLEENDLEFELLKPLIKETFKKAIDAKSIFKVQTGPAVRGDQKILNQHLLFLKQQPDYQHIYRALSEGIAHQRDK
ncbi:Rossmann-like and DUF2520 domain-containing protein [Arcicella lustrica]|uniref:Rossmann-like and DUF2520 domain-containing protein n=1 Tax=Arcicella lustrica TaxID=2984196 RepID=A0ABU5SI88_9BACT|nr:Rossmann-like and DUF2520 domain-containing protein [Arcicella sp. DC25W]MEA5426997.1 Rossmann-like and DUF2520 domain-containing protein [Arcicella sp. DC25W]